jgi:carbamate kinase
MAEKKRIVVALGGNAILWRGEKGTYEEEMAHVLETVLNLKPLIEAGAEMAITHGNGPQVGNILIQNKAASSEIPPMPMFVCDAMCQGEIGYMIAQAMANILGQAGIKRETATVVTQIEVDKNDPAFKNPSKPVGPFYGKEDAEKISSATGFIFKEDAGRGYRRVVPSPEPLTIVEIGTIRNLMRDGAIVIAAGGGGIPVIRQSAMLAGIDAVIDKDKAGALLADEVDADILIILTAVEKVCLNYGSDKEAKLNTMTVSEAKTHLSQGQFAEGSMKPKIEAAIKFVASKASRKALITQTSSLGEALAGKNGTWIEA